MVKQKQAEGKEKPKDLWNEPVEPVTMQQFAKETADTEKVLWFGTSNSGKTKAYLDILGYYKSHSIPKEKVMMCVIFSDRATGITKLYNVIPKEYVDRVFIYTTNCYEDMVSATAASEKKLMEHYKQTGTHGWLIIELLEEAWRMSQDYYSRQAYGETLADYLALQREVVKDKMKKLGKEDKDTAYMGLEGFKDWTVIKFFHNFNWIDKIKKMPFNVGATSEVKAEKNKDSIFFTIGVCPAGEKDNEHRFDKIIYKSHRENKFYEQCFKWTGMSRLYSEIDITDKNSWSVHKKIQKQFEEKGYKSSAIEELEEEAGIEPPKPEAKKEPTVQSVPEDITLEPVSTEEQKTTSKEEVKEEPKPVEEKTITTVTKTPEGEKKEQISKEELVQPSAKKKEKKEEPASDINWSV